MKVKYVDANGKDPNLTLNRDYIVFAIELSNNSSVPGEYIMYRIENDGGSIVPYHAKLFEVVSNKLSSTWVFNCKPSGNYWIQPTGISYNTFWEDFYNCEATACKRFYETKEILYLEELTEAEIKEIICDYNEDKIEFVLNMLAKNKNDTFIDTVARFASNKLDTYKKSDSLLAAFKYLSVFRKKEVEDFFVEYLTNIEKGYEELTQVVNSYFEE